MQLAQILFSLSIISLLIFYFNKKWNNHTIKKFEDSFQYTIFRILANLKFNLLLCRDIFYDHIENGYNQTGNSVYENLYSIFQVYELFKNELIFLLLKNTYTFRGSILFNYNCKKVFFLF